MVGLPVTIEYDEAWDGLTKNLVCRCSSWGSNDGEIRTILNVGETAVVAHEVMQAGQYLHLGLEGFRADGTLVMPTTWARCAQIQYGANVDGDPSADSELPIWGQLQSQIEQLKCGNISQEQLDEIRACADVAVQAEENAVAASHLAADNAEAARTVAEAVQFYADDAAQAAQAAALSADRAEAAAAKAENAIGVDRNAKQTYYAIGVLGDSYSAFEGWIPDGYQPSYGVNNYNGIISVRQMWWWILADRTGATIMRNSSYSGSTICNTGYNGADATKTSYLTRAAADFGASKVLEPKPDLIIIFGGTNDDWAGTALGEAKYADWTADDLKTVAPAFCKLISDLTEYNPGADIVFVLNTGMGTEITARFKEICTHYSVLCVELSDIDKTSGHPSVTGMEQIATQIQAVLGQSGNNPGGEDTGGGSGGDSGGEDTGGDSGGSGGSDDTGGSDDSGDSGGGDSLTIISTKTFNWDVTTSADIPYETHEVSWQAGDTIRVEYNCLTEGGDPGLFYVGVNYQNNILNLQRNTSGEFVLTEDVTELATYTAKCKTTPAAIEVIITQLRGS